MLENVQSALVHVGLTISQLLVISGPNPAGPDCWFRSIAQTQMIINTNYCSKYGPNLHATETQYETGIMNQFEDNTSSF